MPIKMGNYFTGKNKFSISLRLIANHLQDAISGNGKQVTIFVMP